MNKKVKQSIQILQSYEKFLMNRGRGELLEIQYSGGKDSDVLLTLAKMAGIKFKAVYKNTTIDPPYTLKHVQNNDVEILRPRLTFLQLVAKRGWPTMFRRFCCSELKEYYTSPYIVTGVRASESVKRSLRYSAPSECRYYSANKRPEIIMPLVHWHADDILNFIKDENINLHPLYYREDGSIDITKRLGCLGCPLQSDRGRNDFLKYPKLLRAKCRALAEFWKNHNKELDMYDYIMYEIFYSNHGELRYQQTWHGLFDNGSPKHFLEDYFNIELP